MGCTESKSGSVRKDVGPLAAQFEVIKDRFECVEDVQQALRKAGLESCELVLALDLTKSNEWSGERSFSKACLHSLEHGTNPYQSVMSIICNTLSAFDDDKMIPTYGFGDLTSRDEGLLSFDPHGKPIHTLENVLATYTSMIPYVNLSGPTSFAPAIRKAVEHVIESNGRYHILVLIADGQVTGGHCMEQTVQAIVDASEYPLSIVLIGVGDGPWDDMENFDDGLPQRRFDNFQFVNFTRLSGLATAQGWGRSKWEAAFALNALMEVPDQYAIIQRRNMLHNCPVRPVTSVHVSLPKVPAVAQGHPALGVNMSYV